MLHESRLYSANHPAKTKMNILLCSVVLKFQPFMEEAAVSIDKYRHKSLEQQLMVKHIVLFKLKDEVSADEKLAVMNDFKAAIEALPAKIPVIRKIEVGLNMNPGETWNIALYSEFDTLDDVRAYAVHPDHVAAGKLLATVKESRACVDYEL
ncbi:stress responsive alpha/beta barrel protein [Bacteroides zoogleoformans]|nr:stress responsive alpha/beta barrel protein [Bacteroides zoogleoformans]